MRQLIQYPSTGLICEVDRGGKHLWGVWHWNRYPAARVDSEKPSYQFSIPAVWKDWNWTERFPGAEEVRRYFAHVDNVLELGKDAFFNTVGLTEHSNTMH